MLKAARLLKLLFPLLCMVNGLGDVLLGWSIRRKKYRS